jgi:phosphosulfolactate phosphohydrolase-like enzyme
VTPDQSLEIVLQSLRDGRYAHGDKVMSEVLANWIEARERAHAEDVARLKATIEQLRKDLRDEIREGQRAAGESFVAGRLGLERGEW